MEEKVFPGGAVASLLEQNFVEARIHTDHQEKGYKNRLLQQQMVGFVAAPYYLVLDPNTGLVLGRHELSGAQAGWGEKLEAFLKSMLANQR